MLVAAGILLAGAAGAQGTRLSMRDAELSAFIELVAQITGRNFIVDPRVSGTVTIVAPDPIPPDAVYQIFLNVLELNRYTVVEGEGADRIVPAQVARELSPARGTGPPEGFVTQALQIDHMPIQEAVEIIRPLLAPEAVLTPYPSGHLLILSDRRDSVDRVAAILGRLDRPREQQVEFVTLRNAVAGRLVDTIAALDLAPPDATVSADPRSNAILVTGPESFRRQVRALAAELDRPLKISDATVMPLSFADATKIEKIVSRLFAAQQGEEGQQAGNGPAIVADETTNSVLITAPPDLLSSIVSAVRQLDRRPSQVLIEGVIFEMAADRFAQLGVQFGGLVENIFAGGLQFSVGSAPTLGSLVTALLSNNVPALGSGLSVGAAIGRGSSRAAGFLSALARDTSTNILSTPSVLTLDNETAEIVVAQNVPFVTGRFATVGEDAIPSQPFQTIQRQDVGLTLRVEPQITGDGTVRLRVRQEVSNLTTAAAASGGEITQRRAIDTTIIVGDGNLVLLGGLLEEASDSERERLPGLGDIPVVRHLFSAKSADGSKRILLLLLRPTVIRSDLEARRVTERRYSAVRAESAELNATIDDQYPRAETAELPPLAPSLGVPFRAGDGPAAEGLPLLPPLPPRLDLDGRGNG